MILLLLYSTFNKYLLNIILNPKFYFILEKNSHILIIAFIQFQMRLSEIKSLWSWIFSVCICMFYMYSAELWILYISISHHFRPKITLYTRHKSPYTDFSHHWDDCDLICHPRECVVLFSVCVCVGDVCLLSFQSAWGLWLCYFKVIRL